jgi:hypothetical protein
VTRAQMAVFLVRAFGLVDAPAGSVVGSVSGTIIIAVSDDGVSVAIDDTSDRTPDVDSDNDGINDQFSFSLTDLPLNQGITIFLIVGGETFPMYFDSDGSGSSDTNVFSLSAATTVNLGFVNTEVFGEEGRAIPEMNPADDPDIVAGTENQTFPDINPPTGGLTVAELIENGLNALDNAWIGGADDYFEAAVGLGIQNNAAETDLARLFYTLTQMIKWPFETASDGDAGDLDRIGDFLDRLGTPTDEARANSDAFSIPDPLPDDSPTGTEYQDFLFNSVRNDMLNSIDLLTAISPSFNEIIEDPFGEGDVEVDYGDVLALRGTFKVMIGLIEFHRAYDLGMDVDATVNDDTTTTQDFLSDNPAFLSLAVGQTQLAQAKATFISALADIDLAVETINNETDPQLDDFITVDDPIEAEAQLARANQAVMDDGFMNDGATFDLNVLFDVGVDFRNPNRLPPFQGDDAIGLFPDPTFGGAVIGADLNLDVDPADGVPDILQ